MPGAAWILLAIIGGIAGLLTYGAVTSKMVTSPEGIESMILGIRVMAAWDKVIKTDITGGYVNLIFKEPIYKNKLASVFPLFLVPDNTIQLSPFIDDLATSSLLKDVMNYVPNTDFPELAAQKSHWTKRNQEAGVIGLYYLGWLMVWWTFGVFFQEGVKEYLATLGLPNAGRILTFVSGSLMIGLFINAISFIQRYSAEIVKPDRSRISHKVIAYYLSPLVILLISGIVGIGIWAFVKIRLDTSFETFLIFLIGIVSLWVSNRIEGFLYRDNIQ